MQAKKSKIEISTSGLYAKAEVNIESPISSYINIHKKKFQETKQSSAVEGCSQEKK